MTQQLNLLNIPLDLHLEILSFVPLRQVLVYARCCKHFKGVAEDDRVWQKKDVIPISFPLYAPSTTPITNPPPRVAPTARLCLSAVVYQDSLLIYGGDAASNERIDKVMNDFWAFNFAAGGKWEEIPASGQRPVLTEHTAVVYGNEIYLFGGNCGADAQAQFVLGNTVHKIDMASKEKAVKEVKVDSRGIPPRRSAHSAVVYKDKMYIYGGWSGDPSGISHSDFFALDLQNLKWQAIQATGESPGRRRTHCAVVHFHYMYVFGGFDPSTPASTFSKMHRYDFDKNEWETFYGTGDVPRPRARADMVVYQDKIYLVGGYDRATREYFADVYEFNISTHAWKAYRSNLKEHVRGICQHKCVLYKHWLIIVFGHSAKEGGSTNKVFAINLRKNATR